MAKQRKSAKQQGASPGRAEPRRGGAAPGDGARAGTAPARKRTGKTRAKKAKRKLYTPEQRRAALAAYRKAGLTQKEFARLWGISASSLVNWLRRERQDGGRGLEERRKGRAGRKKGQRTLPLEVRAEIVKVKRRFPDFGLRKVRDFLHRFVGLKVSTGTVRAVVHEEQLPAAAVPKRRRRRKPRVRRFERARPNALWQSDITSLWLARPARRVYLTVFLDDHSRYVVGFHLASHQRRELVLEAFQDALVRFGKPKEVLTDQGRQYYSWRGKTTFQKLLEREGIAHVVSRAHHPQTLGKTERLWKTIQDELLTRVQPADVAEARTRVGHFLNHYNHFRPHQGIDGLVPADRFFGAAQEARDAIEKTVAANALALALGEAPRQPVFLFGRIGGKSVSLHGEKGRLVLSTDEGMEAAVDLDTLGAPPEDDDGQDQREQAAAGAATARPAGGEEDELQEGAARPLADPGAVGGHDRGGPAAGAHAVRGAAGVLAGQGDQDRDRAAPGAAAAAGLAAESAGAVRYAGEPGVPAPLEGGARHHDEPTDQGEPRGGAQAPHQGARARKRGAAQAQRAAAAVSAAPAGGDAEDEDEGEARRGKKGGGTRTRSDDTSGDCSRRSRVDNDASSREDSA